MAYPNTQYDNIKTAVTGTPGTGTITIGAAQSGAQTPASAGVPTGAQLGYRLDDGSNWEVGLGTYTVSGTTLSRGPLFSSNSNAAINATSATLVSIVTLAEDINALITSAQASNYLLAVAALSAGPELGGI